MTRAVFFDRDDTLMKNVPYLGDPAQVTVYPEAPAALHRLAQAGFALFLISNQSGVGRGLITPEQVRAVTQEMLRQLGQPFFQQIHNCFEEPEQPGIYQRKPSPHLIYASAREFGLDLARSWFVGDRLADVLVGRNAGCRTMLVLGGHNVKERPLATKFADEVASDLTEVAAKILAS